MMVSLLDISAGICDTGKGTKLTLAIPMGEAASDVGAMAAENNTN